MKMQVESNSEATGEKAQSGKTIAEMIAALGPRNGIAASARKALADAGKEYSLRGIYNTIERNGENNAEIALALFDAIAAAQKTRAELAERRAMRLQELHDLPRPGIVVR